MNEIAIKAVEPPAKRGRPRQTGSLPTEAQQCLLSAIPAAVAALTDVLTNPICSRRDRLDAIKVVFAYALPKPAQQADSGGQTELMQKLTDALQEGSN